jgi:hypothetical protein
LRDFPLEPVLCFFRLLLAYRVRLSLGELRFSLRALCLGLL